jgi:hypothetical protein
VDDQVKLLRLLLAGAQVIIGAVFIVGSLSDRRQPPAARQFNRSPRWSLTVGIVFALCGVLAMVLLSLRD